MTTPARRAAVVDDLRGMDPGRAWEIVGGEVVEKAMPSFDHGIAQGELMGTVRPYTRKAGHPGGGGWWIVPEVEVAYEPHEVYRHDLVGWRRERLPERPSTWPVTVRPDWACEVLSPHTERRDRFEKLPVLHRAGVPWYWLVELTSRAISVYRWTSEGYLLSRVGLAAGKVRLEPFEAVEIDLGRVFGDQDE